LHYRHARILALQFGLFLGRRLVQSLSFALHALTSRRRGQLGNKNRRKSH
jgi:hypothetical protein